MRKRLMQLTTTRTAHAEYVVQEVAADRRDHIENDFCLKSYSFKVARVPYMPTVVQAENLDRVGLKPSSPALSLGIGLHTALDEIRNPKRQHDQPIDLVKTPRRHWNNQGFADTQESEAYLAYGVEVLRSYLNTFLHHRAVCLARKCFGRESSILTGCEFDLAAKLITWSFDRMTY